MPTSVTHSPFPFGLLACLEGRGINLKHLTVQSEFGELKM
jgi:hypothetical protein